MKRLFLALLMSGVLFSFSAQAERTPDYLSVGFGGYDFDKDQERRKSVDYRLDYQWGASLLPLMSRSFKPVNSFLQVHPVIGFEGNTKGAVYGNGGLNADVIFLHHGVFTWGEAVGAFGQGNDPRALGAVLEFRSQLELGWQFDNRLRVTGYISHISNAHVLSDDPGAEIVGMYVHIPLFASARK